MEPNREGKKSSLVRIKDNAEKIETAENGTGSTPPEDEEDTTCGIGPFRPAWLQRWATPRSYLVIFSLIGIVQGCYYTYLVGMISTLEKRFTFESKVSGGMLTVDEITPTVLGIFVGYFGGKSHRPRIIALCMSISALCCIITTIPYFVYGPAQHLAPPGASNSTEGANLCMAEVKQERCNVDDRPPTFVAILCLYLASFLKGFGNVGFYTVGLPYLDDNSKKKNSPIYFTVSFALRLLGPAFGYIMSSAFLKYYENPLVDPGFGPDDPRWIGGWWMGFALQGVILFLFCLPLLLFPRRLPGHTKRQEGAEKEITLSAELWGLLRAVKRLATNPLLGLMTLNIIFNIAGNVGYSVMLPKYMENQFRLSASDASLYSGPPGLTVVMVSTIIGGWAIWKYKPSAKVLTAILVADHVINAASYLVLMIPSCEKVDMYNLGVWPSEGLILESNCNAPCMCTTSKYRPVCDPDEQTTYFSPCHAGCTIFHNASGTEVFQKCSCLSGISDSVIPGVCPDDNCWTQALFFIVSLTVIYAITALPSISYTLLLLRAVDPEDKSIMLGAVNTVTSLLGFIPLPIVFGALVDSVCLVWERSCEHTGNCWFYDVSQFRLLIHWVSAAFSAAAALVMFGVYRLSDRLPDLYADDMEFKRISIRGSRRMSMAQADIVTPL